MTRTGDRITPENLVRWEEATLKWCNEMRASKGDEPLAQLPAGVRKNPNSCPCGAATGLWVGSLHWYEQDPDPERGTTLPPMVASFVHAFDMGHYPELETG